MAKLRIILIVAVLAVMGGIGYMQYATVSAVDAAIDPAAEDYAAYDDEARSTGSSGGYKAGNLIKSTKTTSRVGGDKTITIQRKAPSLWIRIRMWFGYQPEDAHRRDFARLKAQREAEARRNKGVNTVTGRKESTASASISAGSGGQRKAAPNKSIASALGGN